ncbi:MAG: hypothetical protein DME22_02100 [Verrucomicrobia bacterium]|nr:MAG: hypothetical protein DME22_02100 [Verrucomicrobiota bacterium]
MKTSSKLRAGEWVQVRSREEILKTLDKKGQLDSLPFMPQMFQYCGQKFRVYKRAHKTCDTVNKTGGRRIQNAVHLEGLRCDGKSYGGCQAGCLIFWKDAWLTRLDGELREAPALPGSDPRLECATVGRDAKCSEHDVLAGTRVDGRQGDEDPTYVCQATQLPHATTFLPWWDIRQYLEDCTSGNIGSSRIFRGVIYASCYNLIQAGIGLGPILRWLYDRFQALWGGLPYPRKQGCIPVGQRTPTATLNLQPGELVRVRPHEEILATLDKENKNRGLYFDAEAVPYCGGTYRILKRVNRIIDEKTGKLVTMKTGSLILDGVWCQARYSDRRLFCPRSIYTYWREIWLERVGESGSGGVDANAKKASC